MPVTNAVFSGRLGERIGVESPHGVRARKRSHIRDQRDVNLTQERHKPGERTCGLADSDNWSVDRELHHQEVPRSLARKIPIFLLNYFRERVRDERIITGLSTSRNVDQSPVVECLQRTSMTQPAAIELAHPFGDQDDCWPRAVGVVAAGITTTLPARRSPLATSGPNVVI